MKNKDNNTIVRCGAGFIDLLTIAFVVLKLTGFINWSWFWVLSPVLIPVLVGITIFWTGLIILFIANKIWQYFWIYF